MSRTLLLLALMCMCVQPSAKAQATTTLLPAGTLLHCTMDDPNFSTKTVEVGDPVICHMNGLMEFGRPVFPRGAYLAGHLDAAKDPGHFVGKGYMKIVFDRIGLPDMDAPLDAKIVAARAQHVDKQGDIVGHGHAKRDVAEWLFPPLWPWKVLMLPARGPRPTLKTEEVITLRLMEDVEMPRLNAYSESATSHDADAYAYVRPRVQSYSGWRPFQKSPDPADGYTRLRYVSPSIPAMDRDQPAQATPAVNESAAEAPANHLTLIALKSETIYPVTDYWLDGGHLSYVLPNGTNGSTDLNDVDWQRTTDLNAERGVRLTLRSGSQIF